MSTDRRKDSASAQGTAADRRGGSRQPFKGKVCIRFIDSELVGPGENISSEGVFFVTESSVRVEVTTGEEGKVYQGELVRLHSMGGGKTGVAVRFEKPDSESTL